MSPYYKLLEAIYKDQEEAKKLIEKEADINILIDNADKGFTLFYLVSCTGHIEIVRLLIEKGMNVNIRNKKGDTPLYIASKEGRTNTAKLLIEKGAHINRKNKKGETPLYIASKEGRTNTG